MTWEELDWNVLDRLRDRFLNGPGQGGSYWTDRRDLANYDFTYAQRIGWKWDAVLLELKQLGWTPPKGVWLDWGCGSGVASRCVLDVFGTEACTQLQVFDQSTSAMHFAVERARSRFSELSVEAVKDGAVAFSEAPGLLIISHVLNELSPEAQAALRQAIDRASAVIWVEPGTHEVSRALGGWRGTLTDRFDVVAPCTHAAACGALVAGREKDWCHFFADPPAGVLGDPGWVRFARMAGIDLRSLPFSYLVLEKKGLRAADGRMSTTGWSRVLGRPRIYKAW
ncbi:MAG TPA: small ribosomal subunit Rsm22 family protein, partial [Roseimicrobium sp.]|nr:small ribosomal subunit Rsm22 family protein [Roseimicrobium sp.]